TTWTGATLAQEQPTVPADPPPAGSPGVVPEKIEPPPQAGRPDGEGNLTEELAPTGGVIKPPERVDPGMVAPPPDNGAAVTPIIPPPVPPPTSNPE
ncbi:MAG: hypothetical protein AB7X49_26620, partial [Geminicoccaceae bacterium]